MESRRSRNNFGGGGGSSSGNHDDHHLEALNQSMAENLSSKVGQLKSLAIDLDTECKDHIPLLDDMGDDMETGSIRMSSSSNRIRSVAGGSGSGLFGFGGGGGRNGSSICGIFGRCGLSFYVAVGVTSFLLFIYYFLLHQNV